MCQNFSRKKFRAKWSFFVSTFWIWTSWGKNIGANAFIKCWWNWPSNRTFNRFFSKQLYKLVKWVTHFSSDHWRWSNALHICHYPIVYYWKIWRELFSHSSEQPTLPNLHSPREWNVLHMLRTRNHCNSSGTCFLSIWPFRFLL